MKSLKCLAALVAFASGAVMASPAQAGLEFTDTASNAGGTADFTFTGSTAIAGGFRMNNSFNGANFVTLGSTAPVGTAVPPTSGSVDFRYTGFFQPSLGVTYAQTVGSPAYNMVIDFGNIVISGVNGSAMLQRIEFQEFGAGFSPNVYNINANLTAAMSNQKFFIFIPPAAIPLVDRDSVQTVRLTFLMTGGSATSIGIRAVVNPEPGTIALFGLGALGLAGLVRSRRNKGVVAAKTNA
jgi:hypothetical protein